MTGLTRDEKLSLLYSAIAPGLSCMFTNPAEVVKVHMTMDRELAGADKPRKYASTLDCLKQIWRDEGMAGVQRGLQFSIVRDMSKFSFRFGLFDPLLARVHTDPGPAPMWKRGLIGSVSGAVAAFICNPLDLVKTRLMLEAAHPQGVEANSSPLGMAREVVQKEGVLGLWRGTGINMVRSTLSTAATLSVNSRLKELSAPLPLPAAIKDGGCALVAAVSTVLAINPSDVVRTRLYSQPLRPDGSGTLYSGVLHCGGRIVQTEGICALYKGCVASFLRIGPNTVLIFVFVGAMKRAQARWL